MNELKEYYKKSELWLPEYSQWRIFKFRVNDGTKKGKFIKIKDVIRGVDTLRKWLVKLEPLDVYYSANCFLNPTQVKGSQTKNHILFKQTPFDFDAKKPYGIEELEEVRQSVIKLIGFMMYKYHREPKRIIFTGGKGFQVIYEHIENLNMDELDFTGLDKAITTDEFRVIRLPQTVNKLGRLAVILSEDELLEGMEYILSKAINILHKEERAARLTEPMTISSPVKLNGHSSGTAPTDYAQAIFITNKVDKTERFIPILKYNWREQRISPRKDLHTLAVKYGLTEWYLIKTQDELYCFSLVALDRRRLEKVLNSSQSLSKVEFKKFKKIHMRISAWNDTEDLPMPAGVLMFEVRNNKQFLYSRPHLKLVQHFDYVENPFVKYIGHDNLKVTISKFKREEV